MNGGMLMINCKANSKNSVVFERTITLNSRDNSQLLFTAYVNNATAKATNKPVNVLLQITGTDAAEIQFRFYSIRQYQSSCIGWRLGQSLSFKFLPKVELTAPTD